MAGIISNVDKDVQELRKLKNAIEDVKKSLKGINIKVDIDIAEGLQVQLKSLTEQYHTLVLKIAEAEGKILLSAKRINDASEKIIQAQEMVSQVTDSPVQIGNTSAQANMAETASIQAQAKAYDDLRTEINDILGTRDANIKRMVDEMNAIRLINAEIKEINKLQEEYSSLSSAQQKRLEQLNNSLLTHKTVLSEVRQTLSNNAKLDNVATTSMEGLSQSLSRMRMAYRNLTEEERKSPFGKELLASINQADAKIKELDATIGNHQRNVGNYGKQWNGLNMAIQQVGRELPSLAYGPKVFFSAISNNLPILADEIKRARTEYGQLKKSGDSAIPVWKQVVSSLISWQSALTVGITLLTLYGDKLVDWVGSLFTAKKALSETYQSLEDYQKKVSETSGTVISTLERLSQDWKRLGGDIDAQKKFILENKDAIDSMGVSVNDAAEAERIFNTNKDTFIMGLLQRAKAAAAMELAAEEYKKAVQKMMEADAKSAEGVSFGDRLKSWFVKSAAGEDLSGTLQKADLSPEAFAKEEEENTRKEAESLFKSGTELVMKYAQFSEEEQKTLESIGIKTTQTMVDGSIEAIEAAISLKQQALKKVKVGSKEYKQIEAEIKVEQAKLNAITGEKDTDKEADKLRKQQEKLAEDLLSLRRKNQQDEIGLMANGIEKKLAQIDADFDAQTQAIEKKAKDLAKANKEAGITDVNKDGLTKDQQDEIDKARKLNLKARAKEESNLYKAEAEAMRNYLKEYGTFQQQKLAIAEEYAEKIRKAQSEGERLSLEKERDSALLGVDVKAAQQNIDWQSVFGDLGIMLREQIQPTIDNLKKITQSDEFNNSSIEDQQRIYDILSQLERQSGMLGKDMFKDVAKDLELYRNSLNAYNKAQQREVEATNALVKAKENLKRAQENGGDVESARKAVDEAESIFNRASESVKALGDRAAENAEALKTSSEKVRGALGNLAGGLDKLKSDSLSQAFDGVKDIGKSLGGKIGDAIANIDPTGIIGGVLTILDVLKDGVSSIFVSLQDTLYGAIEGILDDVFSGDIIVKPIQNTLGHIGKILDTVTFGGFSSWFGIGGNAKEVQKTIDRLTERNEILGKSIDRLTDIMEKSAGSKAISAYEEARKNQQEKNENLLDIAQAQASYHNSHKSWQHYMGWTDEQLKWAQENVDAGFTGTNSLWNLTPEQMNKLLSNVSIYEQIKNAGKGGYGGRVMEDLEAYAEQAGKIADLEASINESLMNVSFDSMRSSFLDSLMDMEKDAKGFSDDFSEMMQRALLDFSLGETFDDDLKDWYNDVAKAIKDNDGKLSDIQMDDFKRRYDGIVNAAIYERDKIAELTGYTGGKDDTREASQKGIATASQDSVDENNGRLAVMQEHTFTINENISRTAAGIDTIVTHTANLSCLANIDRTMQSILSMRDAALTHLSNIDGHTSRLEAIEHAIVFMKNDINTMLIKGLKLSR